MKTKLKKEIGKMKKILLSIVLAAIFFLAPVAVRQASAGEMDVLVDKLVDKGVLTPSEAQIVVDETKVQCAKDLANGESPSAPDWTQRIKVSGDVRFRTQYDSGKGYTAGPAGIAPFFPPNIATNNGSGGSIEDYRLRERVRARIGLEAQINDYTYAGVRIMGGSTNSNTGNDTLSQYFSKFPVEWDQYWIRFEAPKQYTAYYNDLKLWLGKMPNPMQTTELMWDSNITPGGVAIQYTSPDINLSRISSLVPNINIYSNLGSFVLDESATFDSDPMLWVGQVGMKTSPFGLCGSTFNVAGAVYDFANLQGKTPGQNSAGTNTRLTTDQNLMPTGGQYAYAFTDLDLVMSLDNGSLFSYNLPNGVYVDLIHNTEAPQNNAALVGAYLGKKAPKEKNDWKIRAEWRYIERNALPDFMTDNDWYGFGIQTSATRGGPLTQFDNGFPVQNGTNGKGIVLATEYMILKNTTLNLKYSWMEPIDTEYQNAPWNEFQCDVMTKF